MWINFFLGEVAEKTSLLLCPVKLQNQRNRHALINAILIKHDEGACLLYSWLTFGALPCAET